MLTLAEIFSILQNASLSFLGLLTASITIAAVIDRQGKKRLQFQFEKYLRRDERFWRSAYNVSSSLFRLMFMKQSGRISLAKLSFLKAILAVIYLTVVHANIRLAELDQLSFFERILSIHSSVSPSLIVAIFCGCLIISFVSIAQTLFFVRLMKVARNWSHVVFLVYADLILAFGFFLLSSVLAMFLSVMAYKYTDAAVVNFVLSEYKPTVETQAVRIQIYDESFGEGWWSGTRTTFDIGETQTIEAFLDEVQRLTETRIETVACSEFGEGEETEADDSSLIPIEELYCGKARLAQPYNDAKNTVLLQATALLSSAVAVEFALSGLVDFGMFEPSVFSSYVIRKYEFTPWVESLYVELLTLELFRNGRVLETTLGWSVPLFVFPTAGLFLSYAFYFCFLFLAFGRLIVVLLNRGFDWLSVVSDPVIRIGLSIAVMYFFLFVAAYLITKTLA